jgi:hypothetical protein
MSRRKALPPLPVEVRAQALVMHANGVPSIEIADRLNLKAATVRSWIRRQRKKDSLAEQPDLESVIEVDVPEATVEIPDSLAEKQVFYQDRMADAAVRLAAHVSELDADALVKSADKLLKADQTARKALKLEGDKPVCAIQIGVLCQSPQSGRLPSAIRPRKLLKTESE